MVFLKDILGDELYAQVAAKLEGTDIKLANIADGSFVDKATYDADIEKAKTEAPASVDTSELDGVKAENDKCFYNNGRIQLKTKLTPLEKRSQYVA